MSVTTSICHCCGNAKTPDQYAPGRHVCALCAGLSVYESVEITRATIQRFTSAQQLIKHSGMEQRRQAKIDQYIAQGGKRCSACHALKIPAEYNKCATHTDGLQPICRACDKTRVTLMSMAPAGQGLNLWHTVRDSLRAKVAAEQQQENKMESS